MDDFVKRFNLIDYVVVAESGLMTGKNLTLLQRGNYKYILGHAFVTTLSVDKALEIAQTILTVTIRLPHNRQKQTQTLFLTSEQRKLRSLFDLKKYFG